MGWKHTGEERCPDRADASSRASCAPPIAPAVRLSSRPHIRSASRHAFTLIELLLVVAIIAVMTAVTLPSFVQSIRGRRLQVATRTVVMAGRYARSMAVMSQQEYALRFDLDEARITVGPAQRRGPVARTGSDTGRDTFAPGESSAEPGAVAPTASAPGGSSEIERILDRVRISTVDEEKEDHPPADSGKVTILYRTSGRCAPYTVKIVDEDGNTSTVEVDALASAETKQ